MSRGIVLGKFYPLHVGHISLIKFAEQMVDELIILVDNHGSYSLDIKTRCEIIKKTFPHLQVRGIEECTFQDPSESEDFWPYWTGIIKKYVPEKIDTVIGSMDYVKELANNLKCEFTVVDVERNGIPISATKIRNDLANNWEYLAPESKPHFIKNIALVGAESCGKSTLTAELAKHFHTSFVPEYGRTFVEQHGQDFKSKDFGHIAKAHLAHANALKTQANQILFYDTEAIVTKCWHDFFFNSENSEVEEVIEKQKIDLFILVPVHDAWVEDSVRYHPEKQARIDFYNKVKSELIKRNKRFVEIKPNSWDEIFRDCVRNVAAFKNE